MDDEIERAVKGGLLPLKPGNTVVGQLARRLLIDRDATSILPLLDALQESGQHKERLLLLKAVTNLFNIKWPRPSPYDNLLGSPFGHPPTNAVMWESFIWSVTQILCVDMYDIVDAMVLFIGDLNANPNHMASPLGPLRRKLDTTRFESDGSGVTNNARESDDELPVQHG